MVGFGERELKRLDRLSMGPAAPLRHRGVVIVILLMGLVSGVCAADLGEASGDGGDLADFLAQPRSFAHSLAEGPSGREFSTRVASARDLIGPADSPAGLARVQLKADVNAYFDREWERRFGNMPGWAGSIVAMLVSRAYDKLDDRIMHVVFSDGSSIVLRVERILEAFGPATGLHLELSIAQARARAPGGEVFGPE